MLPLVRLLGVDHFLSLVELLPSTASERTLPLSFVVVGFSVPVLGRTKLLSPILVLIREVLSELIRLLELSAGAVDVAVGAEPICPPVELPIRKVLPGLIPVLELVEGALDVALGAERPCTLMLLPMDGALRVKEVMRLCGVLLRLDVTLSNGLVPVGLLGRLMLGLVVLLKPVTLDGLELLDIVGALNVLDLVGALEMLDLVGALKDRLGVLTLAEGLLTLGELRALGAEEDLLLDRLPSLLLLDLELLLLIFPSDMGPEKSTKARISMIRAILGEFRYLRVNILLLLSRALFPAHKSDRPFLDLTASSLAYHLRCSTYKRHRFRVR